MSEIIVKSQLDWDQIPDDFKGYIYIQSDTRITITERKGCKVVALDNSSVLALGNSSVEAWDNSSVEAWGNSSVKALDNSSVVALDNSVVEAWDNSVVEAWGNVQVCKYSDFVSISTQGNARIVILPKTPQEYCEFYGVTVKDGHAILYKAVSPTYSSFYDSEFVYEPGEKKEVNCDPSTDRMCSHGMHVSHLLWALDYGRYYNEFKILECAVPLDKIVVPTNTDGKVRTSELTVLREVPPEEWGVFGKVLLAQMGKR
jgi:hypothetical protein